MSSNLQGLGSFSPQDGTTVSGAPLSIEKAALPMQGRVAKHVQFAALEKTPMFFKHQVSSPEFQAPPTAEPKGHLETPSFHITRLSPEVQASPARDRFGHAAPPSAAAGAQEAAELAKEERLGEIDGISDPVKRNFFEAGLAHIHAGEAFTLKIDSSGQVRMRDLDNAEPHDGIVAKNGAAIITGDTTLDLSKPLTLVIPPGTPPAKAKAMRAAFNNLMVHKHTFHVHAGSALHRIINLAIAVGAGIQIAQRENAEKASPKEASEPTVKSPKVHKKENEPILEETLEKPKAERKTSFADSMTALLSDQLVEDGKEKLLNVDREKAKIQREIAESETAKAEERLNIQKVEQNKKTS